MFSSSWGGLPVFATTDIFFPFILLTKYKFRALYCLNAKQEKQLLCWQASPLGLSHLEFDQNKSSTFVLNILNILFIQLIHENSIKFQHF